MFMRCLLLILTSSFLLLARQATTDVTTPQTTEPVSIALSPDGESIVFVADSGGKSQLVLHSLGTATSKVLTGTDDAANPTPFWAPDGKSIGYFGGGKLKRIDLESGSISVLADVGEGKGGSWAPDGTILYSRNDIVSLLRISDKGGQPSSAAVVPGATLYAPHFLPDGHRFLFYATGGGVFIGDVRTNVPRRLVMSDSGAVYSPAGYVFYVRDETLFAHRVDETRWEVQGNPVPVARQVPVYKYVPAVSVSAKGDLIYRTSAGIGAGGMHFKWFDRTGAEQTSAGDPMVQTGGAVVMSPDGRYVTMSLTRDGNTDVWFLEVATGKLSRLTSDASLDITPVFSQDSKSIYFTSNRTGILMLYEKQIGGTDPERFLFNPPVAGRAVQVSDDGKWLLSSVVSGSNWSTNAAELHTSPAQATRLALPAISRWPQLSPDGKWLAYEANQSGKFEVYVQSFPSGVAQQVSKAGGAHVRWNPNGRELFYIAPDGKLTAVQFNGSGGQNVLIGEGEALFTPPIVRNVAEGTRGQQYVVTDNGQRFLVATIPVVSQPIKVIRNWKPAP
jgi:Tol biopolymer transport system component